jgi:DNA-directed RNA polymerase specialized sigma24 family protein
MERPDHTTFGADDPVFTALWQAHRRRMLDLAFRMLLDLRDAEDAVQEAFTRLARTDIDGIDDPEWWLVVVTSRLCLDRLRARRRRPTDALDTVVRWRRSVGAGDWGPEGATGTFVAS